LLYYFLSRLTVAQRPNIRARMTRWISEVPD